jgi:hypothetical protein
MKRFARRLGTFLVLVVVAATTIATTAVYDHLNAYADDVELEQGTVLRVTGTANIDAVDRMEDFTVALTIELPEGYWPEEIVSDAGFLDDDAGLLDDAGIPAVAGEPVELRIVPQGPGLEEQILTIVPGQRWTTVAYSWSVDDQKDFECVEGAPCTFEFTVEVLSAEAVFIGSGYAEAKNYDTGSAGPSCVGERSEFFKDTAEVSVVVE